MIAQTRAHIAKEDVELSCFIEPIYNCMLYADFVAYVHKQDDGEIFVKVLKNRNSVTFSCRHKNLEAMRNIKDNIIQIICNKIEGLL